MNAQKPSVSPTHQKSPTWIILVAVACLPTWSFARLANQTTVTITGHSSGPTPFISVLNLTVSQTNVLKNVIFTIQPKPASVTRSISANYSSSYLERRGYLNPTNGEVSVPVFGLYANYSNTVALTYVFTDGSSKQDSVVFTTGVFNDPCNAFNNLTVVQTRTNRTDLSYDFILMKATCSNYSPLILDTDGEVRWIGTAGASSLPAIIFENGIYVSSGSSLVRMEFDGAFRTVADYSSIGVTSTGHHNFDLGKQGFLVEVDTVSQTESVILEVDGAGNVLKSWNLGDIISAAMTAGGDDPSQLVQPAPNDWFHNNAATYRKSDDTLVISGREDFVIAIDYTTGAIKWILGDPTKKWHQFTSLTRFALTLGPNTLPPIGQHAVSITKKNQLLLFDNGAKSLNVSPPGDDRTYSTPRLYKINTKRMTAVETWNYPMGQSIYSPYCSSIYEDGPRNYLIDYTLGGPFVFTEILGLDKRGNKVFDYKFPAVNFCGTAWNAAPIHLENLVFP